MFIAFARPRISVEIQSGSFQATVTVHVQLRFSPRQPFACPPAPVVSHCSPRALCFPSFCIASATALFTIAVPRPSPPDLCIASAGVKAAGLEGLRFSPTYPHHNQKNVSKKSHCPHIAKMMTQTPPTHRPQSLANTSPNTANAKDSPRHHQRIASMSLSHDNQDPTIFLA